MTPSATSEGIRRAPTGRAWILAAAGVFVGLIVLGSGCSGGTPGSGPLRLTVSGQAVIEDPSGEKLVVEGARRLEMGSLVEMVSGQATLEYPGDVTLELRAGTGQADDTAVLASPTPELRAGDVLVVESLAARVEADGTEVEVNGTGKVARRLAVLTQMYSGDAVVMSGGRSVGVPALRQASVPAARLVPASASPLAYDAADPWDRRYLGEAIALGDELLSRARGFTAQLGEGEGRTPGFYRLLLPGLEAQPGFDGSLLEQSRPPGETLVGAAIAVAAGDDADVADRAEFRERWSSVFAFREAGAHWGLVALDHHADRDPLVDRLDAAIGRAPLRDVAIGGSGGTGGTAPLLPPSPPPTRSGEPPPTNGGGDDGGSDPTPPEPPEEDPVTTLLDGLLGGITSSEPSTSDSGGDADSGGLLGGLLETPTTTALLGG